MITVKQVWERKLAENLTDEQYVYALADAFNKNHAEFDLPESVEIVKLEDGWYELREYKDGKLQEHVEDWTEEGEGILVYPGVQHPLDGLIYEFERQWYVEPLVIGIYR